MNLRRDFIKFSLGVRMAGAMSLTTMASFLALAQGAAPVTRHSKTHHSLVVGLFFLDI
jgi:hypothetical protein